MPASPIVSTYDPKLIIMTFGTIIFTGYPDGEFVNITTDGDQFSKIRGIDGGVDRINMNIFDYTVNVTLKQTSLTNDQLSAVATADALTGLGVLPLTIKDLRGATQFLAPQAWIKKMPDASFGNDMGTREWVFDTGPAQNFLGGNII